MIGTGVYCRFQRSTGSGQTWHKLVSIHVGSGQNQTPLVQKYLINVAQDRFWHWHLGAVWLVLSYPVACEVDAAVRALIWLIGAEGEVRREVLPLTAMTTLVVTLYRH